jgi:hypothetical protein
LFLEQGKQKKKWGEKSTDGQEMVKNQRKCLRAENQNLKIQDKRKIK